MNESQAFRFLDLLSFFICAYVSYYTTKNAYIGAVIFLSGFVGENYFRLRAHRDAFKMHKILLITLFAAFILVITSMIAMILLYVQMNSAVYGIIATAFLLILRSMLTHEVILRFSHHKKLCFLSLSLVQLVVTGALFLLFGLFVNWKFALETMFLLLIYPITLFFWLYLARNKKIVEKVNYRSDKVSSFRLYIALLLCSNIALYLSVMTYTGILVLMPVQGDIILPIILWIAILSGITIMLGRLIGHGRLKNAEKSSLFITGGIFWIFARSQLNESFALFSPSYFWVWSLMQAAGVAMMLLLATYMQNDMKLVLEFADEDSESTIKTSKSLIQQVAFVIAGMLIAVELYLINMAVEGRLPIAGDAQSIKGGILWVLNLLPMCFVLLAIIFALMQPLNKELVRKLKLYFKQKSRHSITPEFEQRLNKLLVRRYRNRIGVKIIAFILRPWLRHKVIGAKIVSLENGPVIFIANHREVYGPLVANLYLPFSFRPWIEHKMLQKDKIMDYLWTNTFSPIKPYWLARTVLKAVGPLLVWVLNSVDPIPVYRGAMREAINTIKLSVTALQEQDNILIFPEDPSQTGGKYALDGISPFFTGFVSVAKFYYKQTGKSVTFYPLFANHKKRTITFSKGITYDPTGKDEPSRICDYLMEEMNKMAKTKED